MADQWDCNRERSELFRRLRREENIIWEGRFRPLLAAAETWPRQRPIRLWCGSVTSRDSVELAARFGESRFSAKPLPPGQDDARPASRSAAVAS